jgi:hypothetical protein
MREGQGARPSFAEATADNEEQKMKQEVLCNWIAFDARHRMISRRAAEAQFDAHDPMISRKDTESQFDARHRMISRRAAEV